MFDIFFYYSFVFYKKNKQVMKDMLHTPELPMSVCFSGF